MHGTWFQIGTYSAVVGLLGYWLSTVLKTWQQRATFFLTLLGASVIGKSQVGIVATLIPAFGSILFFERERKREKRSAEHTDARSERFKGFPVRKWDGIVPLVLFDTSQYFFGDSVYAYLSRLPAGADIRLCECQPVYMKPIDAEDLLIGTSGFVDLPENVQRALDQLNDEIATCDPISWEQSEVAVDLADLKERARMRKSAQKELFQ
jgi:hypothetical protein